MLFNSYVFIFGFLPVTFIAFYLSHRQPRFAKVILTSFSLLFYAWWQPRYLILLVSSIAFNYIVGAVVQKWYEAGNRRAATLWMAFGIAVDVAFLGWFKYANFVADNLRATGFHVQLAHIALPLAISFFTFQKIAYLVDSARGDAREIKILDFTLFAAFFPQLIAGPITHYKEIVPQFQSQLFGKLNWRNVMVGLAIFALGLFKKTVIADTLSQYANPIFANTVQFRGAGSGMGWLAAVTFTFQIYFDFSGYSDMAIGLARIFGILLPLNFHSPLRASNIADYWRRWHMTLQRFIVSYIFQPLTVPLSRLAVSRGYSEKSTFVISLVAPLFFTFLIVGIWHGAGWTFVAFGAMHATYVCLHQVWLARHARRKRLLRKQKLVAPEPGRVEVLLNHALTLLAVLFANVMFRATSVRQAFAIWRGMIGLNGDLQNAYPPIHVIGLATTLFLSALIIFVMPNTQQIMRNFEPALNWPEWEGIASPPVTWTWAPSISGTVFISFVLFLGIVFVERGEAVFLYFNF